MIVQAIELFVHLDLQTHYVSYVDIPWSGKRGILAIEMAMYGRGPEEVGNQAFKPLWNIPHCIPTLTSWRKLTIHTAGLHGSVMLTLWSAFELTPGGDYVESM